MFERTKALCDSFLSMGVPGFDLVVYKDGLCVLRYMGGYSDLENKIPVKGDEKNNIYSCSKVLTCVAAMQLWEKNMFSLEDRLDAYMPEFSEMMIKTENGLEKAKKPILIKHLFEMTAGFSYDLNSPQLNECRAQTNHRCPTHETMRYIAKEPLLFEPGERWHYGLSHDVLAALVEVLSNQKFENYVKDHIFTPLGMNQSTFLPSEDEINSLACQYQFDAELKQAVHQKKTNRYRLGNEYASGGAGCVSTVDDYIKFLEALRVGDVILKKETIALMATDRLNENQKQVYVTKATHGYGLGIRTPKEGGKRVDFGWGGAAGAFLAVDIPHKITLYHSQHLLSSPNQALRGNIYEAVLSDILGNETPYEENQAAGEYSYTF